MSSLKRYMFKAGVTKSDAFHFFRGMIKRFKTDVKGVLVLDKNAKLKF